MCTFAREKWMHSWNKEKHFRSSFILQKIKPYVDYYKQQIKSYNDTSHHIPQNEIDLILQQLPTKQKWGIITALVSGFIGLTYEGISSFLHNRRYKALHRAVKAMDRKTTIQCNKLMHLEVSMVLYGIYNAETLEKPINTYIAFTILHHLMKNYLHNSKAQHCFNQYMLICKAYNIIP